MTKNASLHVVRRDEHVMIARIDAPAVAAALTRRAKGETTLGVNDISLPLLERLIAALGTSDLNFSRNEKGKWFVRAVLPASISAQLDAGKAEAARPERFPASTDVGCSDCDTSECGRHRCHACQGTGKYLQGYGICFRCKGKGYTTLVDRRRNAKYAEHRKARADARLAG